MRSRAPRSPAYPESPCPRLEPKFHLADHDDGNDSSDTPPRRHDSERKKLDLIRDSLYDEEVPKSFSLSEFVSLLHRVDRHFEILDITDYHTKIQAVSNLFRRSTAYYSEFQKLKTASLGWNQLLNLAQARSDRTSDGVDSIFALTTIVRKNVLPDSIRTTVEEKLRQWEYFGLGRDNPAFSLLLLSQFKYGKEFLVSFYDELTASPGCLFSQMYNVDIIVDRYVRFLYTSGKTYSSETTPVVSSTPVKKSDPTPASASTPAPTSLPTSDTSKEKDTSEPSKPSREPSKRNHSGRRGRYPRAKDSFGIRLVRNEREPEDLSSSGPSAVIRLGRTSAKFLLDSGSEITLAPRYLIQKSGYPLHQCKVPFATLGGSGVLDRQATNVALTCGKITCKGTVFVSPDDKTAILGRDFLGPFGIHLTDC